MDRQQGKAGDIMRKARKTKKEKIERVQCFCGRVGYVGKDRLYRCRDCGRVINVALFD